MARVWSPAGGGRWIETGAKANAQVPKFATAAPKPAPTPAPLPWTPAGGGQFVGGTPSNVPGGTSQPGAPAPAVVDMGANDRITTPTTIPNTTSQVDTTPTESAEDRRERQTAEAFLRDMLTRFGMGDLAGDIDRLVRESGNNTSVLMNNIRRTQSYQDRFKGFVALQQRGINDLQTEADYINLETEYRQVFRDSGVQNFLGAAGSTAERDAIAKLVGDFSLSVNEVKDRVSDAQRVVAETPQEVRDSLQKFYNVDPATLVSYVLDPTRTSSEINRRANAAIVGGFATRAGLDFGAGVSERVGEFFGRGGDISGTAIEPELTQIADVQRSTQRLADIEKGMLSAEESALSTLDLDIEAKEKVRGLQSRERARFGGTSALTSASLSRGKVI